MLMLCFVLISAVCCPPVLTGVWAVQVRGIVRKSEEGFHHRSRKVYSRHSKAQFHWFLILKEKENLILFLTLAAA